MADIDSLQIAIGASASSAETAIDNLCKTLDKLGNSLNGVNVAKVSAEFAKLKQAVDSIAGITAIGDAVGKLKEINKISVGKRVTDSLAKLGDSVKNLPDMSRLNEMADALQRISGISGNFGSQIAGQMNQIANAGNAASASRAFGGKGIFGKMLKAATGFIGGIKVADLVTKSNQYIEDVNLFTASMGKGAAAAKEYADRVSEVMGIDPADWMRNQGVFQTLITGFGVGAERATIMSQNLTQLGYDLSSFFNIAVTGEGSAMQKIQAAISGELEPIRRLGYDLSYTTLNAYAASMGLGKTIDKMNQAEKAQLRYYALMKQVTVAQGDMSRTLESPANQLRILKAQFEQAARAIGNVFIPIINAMLPPIIAGIKLIRGLAETVASFMGFKLPEIDYNGLDGAAEDTEDINSNLTSAAKQAKDMLAKFDELNVITKDTGSGSGSGATASGIGSDWAWELPQYDFLGQATMDRVEKFYTAFKAWWDDWYPSVMAVLGAIGSVLIINNLAHTIADVKRMTEVVRGLSTVATIAISAIFTIAGIAIESNGLSEIMVEDNVGWDSIGATLGGFAATMLGATFLGKGVAAAAGQAGVMSLKFGIGFAFLATSIEMAIQDVRRANTHGMDIGTIGGALGAGLTGALGLKLASAGAAKLFPALAGTTPFALLSNLMFDIGIGLVIAGVTTAIDDVVTSSHEGMNESVVIGAVTSGLETGLGVALIAGKATSLGAFASAAFGIGMGLTVSSILLDIAEINEVERNGWGDDKVKHIFNIIATNLAGGLGVSVSLVAAGIGLGSAVAAGLAVALVIGAITYGVAKQANIRYTANKAFQASGQGSMSLTEVKNTIAKHFSDEFSGFTPLVSLGNINVENKQKMDSIAENLRTLNSLIIGNDAPTAEQIQAVADAWGSFDKAFKTYEEGNFNTMFAGLNAIVDKEVGELKTKAEQAQAYLRMISGQMSAAQATAANKRDDILRRWSTTATKEEKQWYYQYMQMFSGDAHAREMTSIAWDDVLSGKGGLEYGDVSQLQTYMKQVVDTYTEYADQLDAAKKSYYESYLSEKAYANDYLKLGIYDEATYNEIIAGLDAAYQANLQGVQGHAKTAKEELETVLLRTYAQVVSGLEGLDYDAAQEHFNSKVNPLVETMATVMKSAGIDTSGWVAFDNILYDMFSVGNGLTNDGTAFSVANMIQSIMNAADPSQMSGLLPVLNTIVGTIGTLTEGEKPVIQPADNTSFITSMNEIIDACNAAGQAMAAVSSGEGGSFTWTDIKKIPIPAYANGGFVDEDAGQLFIAREAGAEMVGAIGRKTAVANNDQIVAGITNGVSQANGEVVDVLSSILAVLRAQGSGSGDGTIQPSAGFGRLVKRSLELYGEVTG